MGILLIGDFPDTAVLPWDVRGTSTGFQLCVHGSIPVGLPWGFDWTRTGLPSCYMQLPGTSMVLP